jgi:hypothetical protein
VSLFTSLRDLIRRRLAPPPSTLRNKPGGLARVKFARDEGDGSYAMHGQFVTTVRLDGASFWVLDPPLQFIVRAPLLTNSGRIAMPGDPATVESMHDDLLEPIRDVGDDERSEELAWRPKVPAGEPRKVVA